MPETNLLTITRPCLLCVEGTTDKAFFDELVNKMNLKTQIQVIETKGKSGLRNRLLALTTDDYFINEGRSIGIVFDADNNPTGAFDSICSALRAARLPVPVKPLQPFQADVQVVVMTLPGINQSGTLEDLCLSAFQQDSAYPCAMAYFQCLQENQLEPASQFISKAILAALFAAKLDDKDAFRLEIAVKQSWWNWKHPAFDEVKRFVQLVAGENPI